MLLPLGLVLIVATFCAQLVRAAVRRDGQALTQAFTGTMSGVLFAFCAIAFTTVAVEVVDAISDGLFKTANLSIESAVRRVVRVNQIAALTSLGLADPGRRRPRRRHRSLHVLVRDDGPQGSASSSWSPWRSSRRPVAAGKSPVAGAGLDRSHRNPRRVETSDDSGLRPRYRRHGQDRGRRGHRRPGQRHVRHCDHGLGAVAPLCRSPSSCTGRPTGPTASPSTVPVGLVRRSRRRTQRRPDARPPSMAATAGTGGAAAGVGAAPQGPDAGGGVFPR
ncbi:hypothetical protein SMICM17S_01013 [Streptomyces microflavus]